MTPIDDALQAALAAEQRIVFGYGVLGPHLAPARRPAAHAAQAAHEQLRDRAIAALTAVHVPPAAGQVDYPDLYAVRSAATALRRAIALEEAGATAWRFLYTKSSAPNASTALRRLAQDGLTGCAVRATQWRVALGDPTPTVPFPGI
ncbi:MAG TPA: DUF4439 domain-containing protein [Jatrophihabitantaceae bacterium]|nr:DUF4439 domain-containing protein [Jatrophihabitantaceae bacterium]